MSAILKNTQEQTRSRGPFDPARPAAAAERYRDLFVHVDGSASDEAVIAHAEAIATDFGAHVEVMLAHEIWNPAIYAMEGFGPTHEMLEAERAEREERVRRTRERMERLGCPYTFRQHHAHIDAIQRFAASLSRCADLSVVARPYGKRYGDPSILETILFEGARAAYVVPSEANKPVDAKAVVIGWRDTPECARAIAAAMPFLLRADEVFLVSVTEGTAAEERRQEPLAGMAQHLARHDVNVDVRHLPEWSHPADALLNEAKMTGAGLLVTGAYGRSRLREWILGGVTRELLKRSDLPLLLAH